MDQLAEQAVPPRRRGKATRASGSVSKEVIVREALAMVRADGVSGLSMRKLAARIDSDVSLAYYYVESKDTLMGLVVEEVFATFPLEWAAAQDWREALRGWSHAFYDVLVTYSGLAELLLSRPVPSPNVLVQYDALIGCMRRGGLSKERAALGYVTLHTVVASRVWVDSVMARGHASRAAAARANLREYRALLKSVDPSIVPHFVWLGDTSGKFAQRDYLDFAVDAVIEGLEKASTVRY